MWIIAKIKKNESAVLKDSFKNLLGSVPDFYTPKILIEKIVKNRIYKLDKLLLGNYIFIKHEKFVDLKMKSSLNYLKGVEYILPFLNSSQKEILNFILKCKNNEDKFGYLSQNFFNLEINKKYNFNSGPFVKFVAEILEKQKNKIKVLVCNYTVCINSKKVTVF